MKPSYKEALAEAIKDLEEMRVQERRIAIRIAQLQESITALSALCTEVPDLNSLSLSDAIRLVIKNQSPITPVGVRDTLRRIGYNLERFENPLASIHTAINRMVDAEELAPRKEEDGNKVIPGQKLKEVPGFSGLGQLRNLPAHLFQTMLVDPTFMAEAMKEARRSLEGDAPEKPEDGPPELGGKPERKKE